MRILEQPITITAAQAAGIRWLNGDRRTVKWPDVYLVMRHGGTYSSKWRIIKRHEVDSAGQWHYHQTKPSVCWGGLALVHVHQPTNSVKVLEFYCVPVRHRRAKGST